MSLYRTYRPTSFADVAGQEHVVTTLEQAVKQDKISHAYLFSGVRGTGKTSIARILAKILLTRGIEDATLKRQIEKGVEDGSLVDLTEIDAASNRGIDDIRSLIEKIQFTPVVAGAKVYIIDEVHMLTKEAFNALLKTLEEPPPYAYFILATTELHKIPLTIQSRCQRFLFRALKEDDMVRRLQHIVDAEKIEIERAALRMIARSVGGSLRDAISLLDQLRSLPEITMADVANRIGETGAEEAEAILAAMRAGDSATIISALRRLEDTAVPVDNVARMLLASVRNDLHAAIEEGRDSAQALRTMDALLDAIRDLRASPVPVLALETALLDLAMGSPAMPVAERQATPPQATPQSTATVTPREEPGASAAPASPTPMTTAVSVEAPEVSVEEILRHWPEVLKDTEPASVRMSLKNGQVNAVEGNAIEVSFNSAFHRDKVAAVDASRAVENALEKVFKRSVRLKCVLETERSPAASDVDVVNMAEAAAEIF
jgi:DNA polymerase-3 subunit gamma/tau